MPFKQNVVYNGTNNVTRIYNVNHCEQNRSLPFIDIANQQIEHIGQFLLDTGSEENKIKISSLPAGCDINTKDITYLKGIGGGVIPTLGSAEITIFEFTISFQVVPEDFSIPCEGILGVEYFEKSGAM